MFTLATACIRARRPTRLPKCVFGTLTATYASYVLPQSNSQRETIYALSTPPGKAGIAVIRISGPRTLDVWNSMVQCRSKEEVPEPWKMHKCNIVRPETTELLDDALAVFFKAPKSFTTQDVLEFHVHSGRAVISAVLSALSTLPYARPAEPGEFTKRAFLGGRLDLTQVEGLKDTIDAETDIQRRLALQAANGAVRNRFEGIRMDIIKSLAMIEALIDFGENDGIDDGIYEKVLTQVQRLHQTLRDILNDSRRGEILRSGVRLAIFGPPNAGKSSLLNFLAQREAAIVTSVPGTTRDILELSLDVGGVPVIVSDTAGIRSTDDMVEVIGIERAQRAVQASDIAICVLSLENGVLTPPSSISHLINENTYFLYNKSDALDSFIDAPLRNSWTVSLKTGEGTQQFMSGFSESLRQKFDIVGEDSKTVPLVTQARQRLHLEQAVQFLRAFLDAAPDEVVLAAEELRYAAQAIGQVSGMAIDVENVLDVLFKDFCIGK